MSILPLDRASIEALARNGAKAVCLKERALCQVLGHFKLFADPCDVSMTPHLALDGIYDGALTTALVRHIQPGMRVFEDRAGFGYFSVLIGHLVGKTGCAIACNRDDRWGALLKDNVALNGLTGRLHGRTSHVWCSDEAQIDLWLLHEGSDPAEWLARTYAVRERMRKDNLPTAEYWFRSNPSYSRHVHDVFQDWALSELTPFGVWEEFSRADAAACRDDVWLRANQPKG